MTKKNRTPDIEAVIGANFRRARLVSGMSQTEMADSLGITYQQVQKYEAGKNRLAVSTALLAARAMKASPNRIIPDLDTISEDSALRLTAAEVGMIQALRAAGVSPQHMMRIVLDVVSAVKAPAEPAGGR